MMLVPKIGGCIIMRSELQEFTELMGKALDANDGKRHWSLYSVEYLLLKQKRSSKRLEDAFNNCDPKELVEEATNVANYAMMIANKILEREKDG